ncbi:AAA domain-containing protein [Pelagophyceae sp. CCMP2097]|nr:AAA domain-containing protein [Pelagophyceae sp. CCMP2097]
MSTILGWAANRPSADAAGAGAAKRPAPSVDAAAPAKSARRSAVVFVAVGLPGAGKSSFFEAHLASHGVERICQDILKTRAKCEKRTAAALAAGRSVYIDRTNYDVVQRAHWLRLAREGGARCVALLFSANKGTCTRRCAARPVHEGGLDSRDAKKCGAIVGRFSGMQRPVTAAESFHETLRVPDGRESPERAAAVSRIVAALGRGAHGDAEATPAATPAAEATAEATPVAPADTTPEAPDAVPPAP